MTISILFIFLVHHLITYFTATLTVPKIKDLVHGPQRKYKEIHEILTSSRETSSATSRETSSRETSSRETTSRPPLSSSVLPDTSSSITESTTSLQDLVDLSMLLREKEPTYPSSSNKQQLPVSVEPKSADYFSQLLERKEYLGRKIANPSSENDIVSMKSELKDFLHGHLNTEPTSSSSEPSYYSFLKTT